MGPMKLPFFLAKRFVAGESFLQAKPKVSQLNDLNINATMDLLGENVKERHLADQTLKDYIALIHNIGEAGLKSNISIKLTMMGLDIDRDYCRDNLFTLLEVVREAGQFVRIDMEGSDYTEATIGIYKEAYKEFGKHVGIVIQAYLHRSENDIDELATLGSDVRLVKGAYKEPERLAIQKMPDIREAFKKYAATLMEKTSYPRIATHDDELIEWVKKYAEDHQIDKSRFEFQMLYGLRQNTCEQLVSDGYKVRIYVPYGTMWLPYFTRRLKERKENIWFVFSTMFKR